MANLTKAKVTRAIKGALEAGIEIARIEVDNGKITIIAGKPTTADQNATQNEWDEIYDSAAPPKVRK
jgi:hypothetical protein